MKKIMLALVATTLFVTPVMAFAQDSKLEKRLMALEQKIFSNSSSAGEGSVIADFEARLGRLEEESTKVYGAVEELGHAVDQLAKKMELIAEDMNLRLQDLEAQTAKIEKAQNEAPKVAAAPKESPAEMAKEEMKKEAPAQKAEAKKAVAPKAEKKEAAPKVVSNNAIPTSLSAQEMYSKAYDFLVAAQYPTAESWLKEFIVRHADHELADNAHYWLGEVYLVQERPEEAVVSFGTGLSKFPKGAKASANLLKMGVAFHMLGKDDFAKSSWQKLTIDFPETPEAEKAKEELKALEANSSKGQSSEQPAS